jgi:hypothetical protein
MCGVKTEKKKDFELRGDNGAIRKVLLGSFRQPRSSQPKNEPFRQEMHFKIPLLSRGFEMVKFKNRLQELSFLLLCEIVATIDFLTLSTTR